jgi:hypothetical protein
MKIMNTHADKTQENKSQSITSDTSQKQGSDKATFQFVDNRPEVVAQRKLQEMANNSQQVKQLMAFQDMANNSPQAKKAVQLQAMADNHSAQQQQPIQKKENKTGLPDNLKTGMENLSGMSLDDVKVHRNSDKPAQLQAHAYAQGNDIHLGPSQEKHLPHELAHVVQQKEGRVKPTMQMKGKVNVNDDAGLEKEADVMGAKALQLKPDEAVSVDSSHSKSNTIQRNEDERVESTNAIDQATDDKRISSVNELYLQEKKEQFGNHLVTILNYTDAVYQMAESLKSSGDKAASFNKAFGAFSGLQLAAGLAATALGITLIVITAGAATPAVAAAATGLAAAATGAGITGGVAGVGGAVAKSGRKNAMGEKNKGMEHLSDPNTKKKAAAVNVSKVGAVQGGLAGAKEGSKAITAEASKGMAKEAAVETAKQSAAFTGQAIGLGGGLVTTYMAQKGIRDAYSFDSKSFHDCSSESWDQVLRNIQNFKISMGMKKNIQMNANFCTQVRATLKATEANIIELRAKGA